MLTTEQIAARLRALLAEIDAPVVQQEPQQQVQQTQQIGGGSTVVVDTSAYANVKRMSLPASWLGTGAHTLLITQSVGGFGPSDAIVVEITTPATLKHNAFASVAWMEWGGAPWPRDVTVSDTECGFDAPLQGSAHGKAVDIASGTLHFSIGPNDKGWPALALSNHTYYLNIRNHGTSPSNVDIRLEFVPPKS